MVYQEALFLHGFYLLIKTAFSSGKINLKGKNMKAGKYEFLGKAVFKWFMSARSNNIPVSGLVLQEKANDFAKMLGIADFKASDGWVVFFKFGLFFQVLSNRTLELKR